MTDLDQPGEPLDVADTVVAYIKGLDHETFANRVADETLGEFEAMPVSWSARDLEMLYRGAFAGAQNADIRLLAGLNTAMDAR